MATTSDMLMASIPVLTPMPWQETATRLLPSSMNALARHSVEMLHPERLSLSSQHFVPCAQASTDR